MNKIITLLALALAFQAYASISNPAGFEGLAFGHQELESVAAAKDSKISIQRDDQIEAEGFRIEVSGTITLYASDSAGATYGLLELAEQFELYGSDGLKTTEQSPRQADRGIKFNIPLDVRTPTYTESSDAAQNAIPDVWERSFWYPFLDELARNRYNLVSLWNLHPFPSLVKVPEYPDIALNDVRRSTGHWEEHYPLQATGYDRPEIVDNYETLKVMSIEEKIDFWRDIMSYAKERHIKFYFVTWNIFTNGTAGKYGIDNDIHNPTTRDYFRASVRAMFDTYPDLAGIGLTTGENMPGAQFEEKEDWAFETYGLGTLDAAKKSPDRDFTFIHRQHQTRARDIADVFEPLIQAENVNFLFSFKYAQAHVMSSVRQPFADQFIQDIPPQKTLWTLRNDDNYLFRWGGANFTRDFLANIPQAVSAGVYYGSDQWVWVREFLSKEPQSPRELSLHKHWYHWLLWGRLSYDPQLNNDRLAALVSQRFPEIDGQALFEAWNESAMIYPLTTGFHWGALDFQWYIEACQSLPGFARTPSGFHDINRFITLPPHPGTNYQSIPDFVAGKNAVGPTPFEIASKIETHAQNALARVESIDSYGNRDLRRTLEDIRAQSYLGIYYANKIRAATELARLRTTFDRHHQDALEGHLNQAAYSWRLYAATATALYEFPLWTNRVGYVDLADTYQDALYDLTICGANLALPSAPSTANGTVLEAELANSNCATVSDMKGFTGSGYIDTESADGTATLTWCFNATRAGTYLLEFRHIQRWGGAKIESPLIINGTTIPFYFIHSGGRDNWVWDRATVQLHKGENIITLQPGARPLIDHLNVIDTGY